MNPKNSLRSFGMLVAIFVIGLASVGCANDMNRIEKTSYREWPDAYKLSNGSAEVIVVPAVGRIMSYSLAGGKNVLWEDPTLGKAQAEAKPGEWVNMGGDKVWPWPQKAWAQILGHEWPPPPGVNLPQKAEIVDGTKLRLTSPLIDEFGSRIVREISLAKTGSRVTITTKFEQVAADSKWPYAAWTITQIHIPDYIIARTFDGGGHKDLWETPWGYIERDGKDYLVAKPTTEKSAKLGIDADLLAAVKGNQLFVQWFDPHDPVKTGDRAQIYFQPGDAKAMEKGVTGYIELELTSPQKKPAKGEAISMTVHWELKTIQGSSTPAEAEKLLPPR